MRREKKKDKELDMRREKKKKKRIHTQEGLNVCRWNAASLEAVVHAFLSIWLHDDHETVDPCDHHSFYKSHPKRKDRWRKERSRDLSHVWFSIFSVCTVWYTRLERILGSHHRDFGPRQRNNPAPLCDQSEIFVAKTPVEFLPKRDKMGTATQDEGKLGMHQFQSWLVNWAPVRLDCCISRKSVCEKALTQHLLGHCLHTT